ncbi:MAG: ATPase [Cytophagales bacterium]|nr:MAG: ATPase [Cytophagales bacterium]
MRIKSIQIEKLFDLFNYDIPLDNPENVSLITGPNGYGKTMILNIIFNLFNRKFEFFHELKFEKITLKLEDEIKIVINNQKSKDNSSLLVAFYKNDIEFDVLLDKINYDKDGNIEVDKMGLEVFEEATIKPSEVNNVIESLKVHIIQEQRLFKEVPEYFDEDLPYYGNQVGIKNIKSVQYHSEELSKYILLIIQKSFEKTQELDSTYIDRLIDEKNIISENDYISRLKILNEKQSKLIEFGLFTNVQKNRDYSEVDAKALLVFIKDLENKLKVFDDLLTKITLFATILNERRFTHKSIKISKEKGFYFQTSKGKELKLNQLSSGEQHEVVLLYELIFNTKPNVLLLIDEPEISLHIVWQKEFLNDLITIAKLQNIQVIVATHAPAIVNGRWDLTSNLAEIAS